MRGINRNLSHTLTEIDTAANQVSMGSDQLSSGAQSLSQGAAEQASSVEELSATLLEITQHIKKVRSMQRWPAVSPMKLVQVFRRATRIWTS